MMVEGLVDKMKGLGNLGSLDVWYGRVFQVLNRAADAAIMVRKNLWPVVGENRVYWLICRIIDLPPVNGNQL